MNAEIRRKLAMAARVLDFSQANPSTDPSYVAVLARLQDRVTRADTLAMQQRDGKAGESAAVSHREAIRGRIQQQLRHLARVAQMAAKTNPELPGQFSNPDDKAPYKVFVTAAKSMLAAATPEKDLLISLGLGATSLDDLTQAIAQFDAATEAVHTGRRAHVGARADLRAVTAECVKQVGVLDGLNRARFADNPELLAAWESASMVVGSFRSARPAPPLPSPVPDPVPAPALAEPGTKADKPAVTAA